MTKKEMEYRARYERIERAFKANALRGTRDELDSIVISKAARDWATREMRTAVEFAKMVPENADGGIFFLGLMVGIFLSEIDEGRYITREK